MDEVEKMRLEIARLNALLESESRVANSLRDQNEFLCSIILTFISHGKSV